MRHYEMMIILDPSLEERTVQPSLEQFLNVVTTAGGTVDKVDVWGRRRLAYEIDKKSEGIYTVVDMTAEPDTVKELDRQLNLNEAVLRTKIVRPDQYMTAQGRARARPEPPERPGGPRWPGDTQITIVGNLVDDPQLRYTPTGQAVANFRVASTPRFRDNATGEWKDGDSLFLSCNVWRQAAENVAESLQRGMRVIVQGGCGSGPTRPRKARSARSTRSRSTRSARRCATPRPRSPGPAGPPAAAASAAARPAVRPVRRSGGGGQSGYGGGGGRPAEDPWASEPAAATGSPTSRPF